VKHVNKGRLLIAEGKTAQAGVELRNAMRLKPKEAEPLYLAGRLGENEGNFQSAFQHYRRAVELDPAHKGALARLALFQLIGNNLDEAEASSRKIQALDPGYPTGLAVQGGILAARGKIAEAIALAEAASEKFPADTDIVSLLVGLYIGKSDGVSAQRVLARAIDAAPGEVRFRATQAFVSRRLGQWDAAEVQYREIVRLAPESRQHRLTLATFLSGRDRLDESEKVLRESVAADPKDEARVLSLAEFLSARRSPEVAIKELKGEIARAPKAYQLQNRLAALEFLSGRPEEGEKLLRNVIEQDSKGASAAQARAALLETLARAGRREDADKVIASALKRTAIDKDALLWRGRFALADQRPNEAITDARTVIRDNPDLAEAYELLVSAYRANGQADLGLVAMRDAVERFPLRSDLRLMLADQLVAGRLIDEARTAVDAAIRLDERGLRPLAAKFSLLAISNDWAGALAVAERMKVVAPQQATGHVRAAQAFVAQAKQALAVAELTRAVDRFPLDEEALTAWGELLLTQRQVDVVKARLLKLTQERPKFTLAHMLLGNVALARREFTAAETAYVETIRLAPDRPAGHMALTRAYAMQGKTPAAIETLEAGLKKIPDNPAMVVTLAQLQSSSGDTAKARTTLEAFVARNPANDLAVNNLAALISETETAPAQFEQAAKLAERFRNTDNPYFLDTLGRLQYQLGRFDDAVTLLQKAVKLAPDYPVIRFHLGMALFKAGDVKAAKAQLREALAGDSTFPGVAEARQVLKDS
jgi:tetratricopeptide (TPR) repeat protein